MNLLTPKQAAEILFVSTQTLRRWEDEGKIESIRTGGNHRRYEEQDIQQLLEDIQNPVKLSPIKQTTKSTAAVNTPMALAPIVTPPIDNTPVPPTKDSANGPGLKKLVPWICLVLLLILAPMPSVWVGNKMENHSYSPSFFESSAWILMFAWLVQIIWAISSMEVANRFATKPKPLKVLAALIAAVALVSMFASLGGAKHRTEAKQKRDTVVLIKEFDARAKSLSEDLECSKARRFFANQVEIYRSKDFEVGAVVADLELGRKETRQKLVSLSFEADDKC